MWTDLHCSTPVRHGQLSKQLLPEQRLECLELAQVMAASKREDEEQRAGVAVAEAREGKKVHPDSVLVR